MDVARERYYLGGTFVVEHRPGRGPTRASAVVLLPPMGYEDTCAYRPARTLADALAAAGHVVLRIDWPWLGDGGSDAWDPALPERAADAVRTTVASLRARGLRRVAGVAVRAGGLLALRVADRFDALALWAVPASGAAYLREERAFERLSAARRPPPPDDAPALPAGALEAGGFVYGPALVAALEQLDVATMAPPPRPMRVLLIGRDGTMPPAAMHDALARGGAQVEARAGRGLGDLLEDPYRARLDPALRDALLDWLDPEPGAPPASAAGATRLAIGAAVERPWRARGGAGELSGIVCEPADGTRPGAPWTLFLNAGGVRRSGPNRLWTTAARALAARGRPSLRVDVRDIGDSDGTVEPHRDLEAMYAESAIADAVQAWDWAAAGGAARIDVVGLCSGAFLGLQLAARRPVRRAVLFNGLAYVWDDAARADSVAVHVRASLLDRRRWARLLGGRIDARRVARALVERGRLSALEGLGRLAGRARPDPVEQLLRAVRASGTTLRIVASEGDPSLAYLERHVRPAERPQVTLIPGADHTIRPVRAHARVVALVTGEADHDVPTHHEDPTCDSTTSAPS